MEDEQNGTLNDRIRKVPDVPAAIFAMSMCLLVSCLIACVRVRVARRKELVCC